MKIKQKKGFTLVELLVVISIIGMLMALLLPAVQMAREAGRRATCMNNQKNVSFAMLNYASGSGELPGFLNRIAVNTDGDEFYGGWPTVLLPLIERTDLWDRAVEGYLVNTDGTNTPLSLRNTGIDIFVCPSDPEGSNVEGALSYRVNAGNTGLIGVAGEWTSDNAYSGLFDVSRVRLPDTASGTTDFDYVTTHTTAPDAIRDGTTLTLLMTEGLISPLTGVDFESRWSDGFDQYDLSAETYSNFTLNSGRIFHSSAANVNDLERHLGFVVPWSSTAKTALIGINRDRKTADTTTDIAEVRPSGNPTSYHPGIVVVTYADGHQATLAENIDVLTYLQLVAPDDRRAYQKGIKSSSDDTPTNAFGEPFGTQTLGTKILNESDF